MKRLILLCCVLFLFLGSNANIFFKHIGKSEGLPQISVVSICQDELGRMWFGTLEGLCSYDGNSIVSYKPSLTENNNFLGNEVHNLISDRNGNVFFTSDDALIRYDIRNEKFAYLRQKVSTLHSYEHNVWAAVRDSLLNWNPQTEMFECVYRMPSGHRITEIYNDVNNCLWIGTTSGLFRIDNIKKPSPVCVIPDVHVNSLYRDSKTRMWVAAYRGGMYKIENGISTELTVESEFSISNNDVRCFVEDNDGSIWIGTFNGLNKIDTLNNVSYYSKDTQPGSLKHSSVFSLFKDKQGTVWIGTYYGGVHYFNPEIDCFKHYAADITRNDCLSFFFVGNMAEDINGDVWICTEGGGLNYLNRKTGFFSHFLADDKREKDFYPNLKCISYDKNRNCLYIGTHKQGFITFDITSKSIVSSADFKETGAIVFQISLIGDSLFILSEKGLILRNIKTHTTEKLFPDIPEVHKPAITFYIDSDHFLWISQYDQLLKINLETPSENYVYKYGKSGLGKFHVLKIIEDAQGSLFFGTNGSGLFRYNKKTDLISQCKDLGIQYCYNLLLTPGNNLAISNERGLLIYNTENNDLKMIDTEDQLHLAAINDGCGLLLSGDGEIFVGGTSGMSSFNIESLLSGSSSYTIYLSSIKVNDHLINHNDHPDIINEALPFVSKIVLDHDENNISLSVASNSYIDNAHRKIYEYKLSGLNNEWSTTSNNNIVFTNLDPGSYKLIVREKKQNPYDQIHYLELAVIIRSPWWFTWYAWLFYCATALAIALILFRNWKTKVELRSSLEQEKIEKEKNEELSQAKIQFFTNISHEFRTPLTLIISQLESLLQINSHSPYMRTRLQKVYRNTFQFRDLITELLDFNKMERSKLSLNVCNSDIIHYLKDIHADFQDQAQYQNINFTFHANVDSVRCWFDMRQLKRVFSNLLSNAFKHTPANGSIGLYVSEQAGSVEIKVMDNGEGISQESLPLIFDRFYQINPAQSSPGSGIGLALSKGIVEMHHGEISVNSSLGYGSVFTVLLPKHNPFEGDQSVVLTDMDDQQPLVYTGEVITEENHLSKLELPNPDSEDNVVLNKDCVLIVEDNEDLLQILISLLSPLYRVVIAMDGKEGLNRAAEEFPDLILSDIMMPKMTGIEMCAKIKTNFDLCHTPVILLTALTSDNKKMEGLQCGADDYIEKPFNNQLLLGHIANLIRNRKLLKNKFCITQNEEISVGNEIQTLALNPIDSKFLLRLEEVITENLSDPEFDVNKLAKELAVSRSSLYNKLKALSCMTPNEFILNIRLKQASVLLRNNPELQITEIAYQTGFNSLRYFRHCFKSSFNMTPQDYRVKD